MLVLLRQNQPWLPSGKITRAFDWSQLESYGTCGKSSERFRI